MGLTIVCAMTVTQVVSTDDRSGLANIFLSRCFLISVIVSEKLGHRATYGFRFSTHK